MNRRSLLKLFGLAGIAPVVSKAEIETPQEVSTGYLVDIDFSPGITEDGHKYIGKVKSIKKNGTVPIYRRCSVTGKLLP